ncbi:MAG: hypothetical protein GY923_15400 [Aestuariibacter sp.]|nr:hypothetical protein [Aestuariibacter sp.]
MDKLEGFVICLVLVIGLTIGHYVVAPWYYQGEVIRYDVSSYGGTMRVVFLPGGGPEVVRVRMGERDVQ